MSAHEMVQKASLTIKEMAAASGLSEHTLRYYERIGLIRAIPRDESSGHRRYIPDTVAVVESLVCLRTSGLSIEGMRRYLSLREQGDAGAAEQKQLFESGIAEIDAEIRRLEGRKLYLAAKVAYWEARRTGDVMLAEQIALEIRQIGRDLK